MRAFDIGGALAEQSEHHFWVSKDDAQLSFRSTVRGIAMLDELQVLPNPVAVVYGWVDTLP